MQSSKKATQAANRKAGKRKARRSSVIKAEQDKKQAIGGKKILPPADLRNTPASSQLYLSNSLNTIALTKFTSGASQLYFPIGYLSNALQKGFMASQLRSYDVAYAWQYMTNMMTAYMSSTIPLGISVPYWFLCFLQGIQPKTSKFGVGHATYQWSTQSLTVNNGTLDIGYQPYGYKYTVLPPEGTPLPGGIPTAGYGSSPPAAYTDVLGGAAFQELVNFMESHEGSNMSKKTPISIDTTFSKDVSCFAVFSNAEGSGCTGNGGGVYGVGAHEVKITSPLLATAICADDTENVLDPTRANIRPWTIAGDPVFSSFIGSNLKESKGLYDRVRPVFKTVDFLEFLDVFALYITKMTQAWFDDIAAGNAADASSFVTCPLTLQEIGLLLRNTIMNALKNTQPAVQGIYPLRPNGPQDNQFVPFTAGSSTCAIAVSDIQLPVAFIENIQCISARASRKTGEAYVPILGQYVSDSLDWKDYKVDYHVFQGPQVTTYAFKDPSALYYRKTTAKDGSVIKTTVAEPPISYVDGASGSNLAYINDPKYLNTLSAKYNDWFNSGPNTYSTKVGKFNSQGGLNALAVSPMTRVWYNQLAARSSKKHPLPVAPEFIDSRSENKINKRMETSVYSGRLAISATSNGPILSTAYEQFLSLWILPQIEDEVEFDGSAFQSTALTRWQGIVNEPYLSSSTSGNDGILLSALHESYASKLVRGKLSPSDDWSDMLKEFEEQGRGGIFSSLAGLVGTIWPSASGIANTVGGIADAVTGF